MTGVDFDGVQTTVEIDGLHDYRRKHGIGYPQCERSDL
jgi:hypothetical protein